MKKLITYGLILFSCIVSAQEKDKKEKDADLPKGNAEFTQKKYADAEADYRVSHSRQPEKSASSYNLGNSIYRQNQNAEAKSAYLDAIKSAKTHPEKHMAYHNLGNIYMKEKKYSEAVDAYKNALRNNPEDEQTRYNYALAKKFLKDNPPPRPPKDKKDNKKDKKDPKKDKKDDKKPGDKDKKDQPKDQGQNKPNPNDGQSKDQGQPKPKPGGISKQRLENLLEAVNNEEKKVQEKVNAKKVKAPPIKTEKDW